MAMAFAFIGTGPPCMCRSVSCILGRTKGPCADIKTCSRKSEQGHHASFYLLPHTTNVVCVDTDGGAIPMRMLCRCPQILRRSAASLTAGRVSSARSSPSRRWGCAAATPRAAAATAEKAKAVKGSKPGSDKDKRITPKSTDFSR